MLINISRVGVRKMGPNPFQWCPATGQGTMGTNWSVGSSIWTWGRTSSLWGWRSTGTGCPGRLWSLLLWRYSRPAWTRSCAACCRWPCLGRRVGLDDPQRSLPTPTILWFCDSVINIHGSFACPGCMTIYWTGKRDAEGTLKITWWVKQLFKGHCHLGQFPPPLFCLHCSWCIPYKFNFFSLCKHCFILYFSFTIT